MAALFQKHACRAHNSPLFLFHFILILFKANDYGIHILKSDNLFLTNTKIQHLFARFLFHRHRSKMLPLSDLSI